MVVGERVGGGKGERVDVWEREREQGLKSKARRMLAREEEDAVDYGRQYVGA